MSDHSYPLSRFAASPCEGDGAAGCGAALARRPSDGTAPCGGAADDGHTGGETV